MKKQTHIKEIFKVLNRNLNREFHKEKSMCTSLYVFGPIMASILLLVIMLFILNPTINITYNIFYIFIFLNFLNIFFLIKEKFYFSFLKRERESYIEKENEKIAIFVENNKEEILMQKQIRKNILMEMEKLDEDTKGYISLWQLKNILEEDISKLEKWI